jgi:hypothetical protein
MTQPPFPTKKTLGLWWAMAIVLASFAVLGTTGFLIHAATHQAIHHRDLASYHLGEQMASAIPDEAHKYGWTAKDLCEGALRSPDNHLTVASPEDFLAGCTNTYHRTGVN